MYYALGIETSCDETSVALVYFSGYDIKIVSMKTFSQVEAHEDFFGVVPEIASRMHLEKVYKICREVISGYKDKVKYIFYSDKIGLINSLLVGKSFALGLGLSLGVEVVPVNHIDAHVFSCDIERKMQKGAFISVLASGGHTEIRLVNNLYNQYVFSKTNDDSLGEAFDKVGKMMGIKYPAGQRIEELARSGDRNRFFFVPDFLKNGQDFSFSGVKTKFLQIYSKLSLNNDVSYGDICDISASFEKTVLNILLHRLELLVNSEVYKELSDKIDEIHFVGGVASNEYIRNGIIDFCGKNNLKMIVPNKKYCTDNAAMVASVGCRSIVEGYSFFN